MRLTKSALASAHACSRPQFYAVNGMRFRILTKRLQYFTQRHFLTPANDPPERRVFLNDKVLRFCVQLLKPFGTFSLRIKLRIQFCVQPFRNFFRQKTSDRRRGGQPGRFYTRRMKHPLRNLAFASAFSRICKKPSRRVEVSYVSSSTDVGPTRIFPSTVGETKTPFPAAVGSPKTVWCTNAAQDLSSKMYSPLRAPISNESCRLS